MVYADYDFYANTYFGRVIAELISPALPCVAVSTSTISRRAGRKPAPDWRL